MESSSGSAVAKVSDSEVSFPKAKKKKGYSNQPQDVLQFEEEMSQALISPFNVARARASELRAMLTAVNSRGGSKRTFQRLPRHMRRRAMSYDVKRLPRKVREEAHAEVRFLDAY